MFWPVQSVGSSSADESQPPTSRGLVMRDVMDYYLKPAGDLAV